MQTLPREATSYGIDIARPGVPTSDGMTTVKPASTTSLAKWATLGVMPGISWIDDHARAGTTAEHDTSAPVGGELAPRPPVEHDVHRPLP